MSLRLHVAANSSDLLRHLREQLRAAQQQAAAQTAGVPPPISVLVPTPIMADWLQVQLARHFGLSMGFEFVPPATYVRRRFTATADGARFAEASAFWAPENLAWRLLPHIDRVAAPLGHTAASLGPRTRFASAGLLAAAFDRYARYRPDWPGRWAADQTVCEPTSPATADEAWQRGLWRRVAMEAGVPPHPATLLKDLFASHSPATAEPPVFAVLTQSVDPLLLETFRALAEHGREVSLHILLPALGFLGDVQRRHAARVQAQSPGDEFAAVGAHPLIASLGQQAVGTFLLLGEAAPDYEAWPELTVPPPPVSHESPLLRRLQHDIRHELPPPGAPASPDQPDSRPLLAADDHSLRVHSCHGPRRELEVLRDELLRAFRELPDLRPEQVLVGLTDFDAYAPLVAGVLQAGNQPLPVRLTAISAREANPVAVALIALLRLSLGRCCASELIELLNLAAVQHQLGIVSDADATSRLAELIRRSGVTHGCDAEHRGFAEDTGTWRAALDRVLAGAWFGPEPCVPDRDGRSLHPVAGELAGDEALSLRFVAWLTGLALHLQIWRQPAPPAAWPSRLIAAADELLYAEPLDDDAAALRRTLAALEVVPAETPVDAGTLLDWLEAHLANATSLRTSMGGEILVGRLDQIHGLPCRVLAIAGLQDGALPRANRRAAWDLLAAAPQRWDNDSRTHDRQVFLDSVLAPADRLILCASNRSSRTGHDGPLSACVEELLRIAAATVRTGDTATVAEKLVVRHRIQPFSREYFVPSELPRSFDAAAARIAAEFATARARPAQPFFTELTVAASPVPRPDETVLTLEQLIAFWKNPALAWLRALQIDLPADEQDDAGLDQAPLKPDALQAYGLREEILAAALVGSAASPALIGRLCADRALPPGALGPLLWRQYEAELEVMTVALKALRPAYAPVALDVRLPGGFRLTGQVTLATRGDTIFAYRPGKYDAPRHQLDPFVRALAAAAHTGRPVGARVLGTDAKPVPPLGALPPDEARQVLEALLAGYVAGQTRPLCYAPLTSAELAARLEEDDETTALAAARTTWAEDGYNQPAEGNEPAAALAWRERDAFAAPFATEWLRWARAVAAPLRRWWKGAP